MAINQYGMPEGYDQTANPSPRQRKRPVGGGFGNPPAEGGFGSGQSPDPTAWGGGTAQPRPTPPPADTQTNHEQPVKPPPYVPPVVPTPPVTGPSSPAPSTPSTTPPVLPGFDPTKWADTSHQSPKYVWGRAAAMFNLKTPEGRAQALAFAKQQAPQYFGSARLEGDKLFIDGPLHDDFNGMNSFDVIVDEEGAATGAWQPFGQAYEQYEAAAGRPTVATEAAAQAEAARQAAVKAEALKQATQTYAPGQPPQVPTSPAAPTQAGQMPQMPAVPRPEEIARQQQEQMLRQQQEQLARQQQEEVQRQQEMARQQQIEVQRQESLRLQAERNQQEQVRREQEVRQREFEQANPFSALSRVPQGQQGVGYGIGADNDLRTYEPINPIPELDLPEFQTQEQAQLAALMGVLENPGIPPAQLEQMKRMQQEQLMATRDATIDQTQENFLRRGLRGGALGAAERRTNEAYGADLTRSSRDIDVQNAGMRTQDILNASSGLSSAMDGAHNRGLTGHAAALNRVLAGEGLRGASADSYRGVYNDDAGWAMQNANFAEQMRQYDLSQQLALKSFLEGQRQFDSGMGLNYAQLQQRQNEAVLRALGLA